MRMIATDDPRATCTLRAESRDQHDRINLERDVRPRGHVRRGHRTVDPALFSEQQPADFVAG
jgi:hypothetical protein